MLQSFLLRRSITRVISAPFRNVDGGSCDVARKRMPGRAGRSGPAARRACRAHPGDAGGHQSERRYLRRLDHVDDGRGGGNHRDPAGRRAGGYRRRQQHLVPAAGQDRRRRVLLYRRHRDWPQLNHALCRGLGTAAGSGERVKVTAAEFVFVALDGDGRPRSIRHAVAASSVEMAAREDAAEAPISLPE